VLIQTFQNTVLNAEEVLGIMTFVPPPAPPGQPATTPLVAIFLSSGSVLHVGVADVATAAAGREQVWHDVKKALAGEYAGDIHDSLIHTFQGAVVDASKVTAVMAFSPPPPAPGQPVVSPAVAIFLSAGSVMHLSVPDAATAVAGRDQVMRDVNAMCRILFE